jgi:hypothetical protein
MKKYLLLLILSLTISCSDENEIKTSVGYFIFYEDKIMNFNPVKKMDLDSSLLSFDTKNLKKGFQCCLGPDRDILKAYIDTVRLYDSIPGFSPFGFSYIVPVKIQYKKARKMPGDESISKEIFYFSYNLGYKKVKISYDFTRYDVIKIEPLKARKKHIMSKEDRRLYVLCDSCNNAFYFKR